MAFLLVHSPVAGPSTWRPAAQVLGTAGHDVVVPDLRSAAATGDPDAFVSAAAAAAPPAEVVLVGHSGAGFFLPHVAARLALAPRRLVFVDASIPPCEGEASAAGGFLDQLRSLAADGVLPPWPRWFGEGTMEALVPEATTRAAVEAEMPPVPLGLFETTLAVPTGWCRRPGAFLQLSDPYAAEADRAAALGWPVRTHHRGHLEPVNDPALVAQELIELAGVA